MPILTNQKSRLLGGGRLPVPAPVLGAELLTNGDMETWSSATNAGTWSEIIAGTSTINQDSINRRSGTYCARLDIDASNNNAALTQANAVVGTWYLVSVWAKLVSGAGSLAIGKVGQTTLNVTLTSSYAQYNYIIPATTTQAWLLGRATASSASIAIDDASVKPITLASMFSTRPYGTHVTVKAQATVVAGTRAGVVCNLDSASAPSSFVIASHDGTTARLTSCAAGVYTEKISATVAYSAGAYVEIRRLAGTTTYQLWYAGSQVGTNQTIADAAIVDNVLAGYFQTYAGNTLTGFSCVPS